jgi:peroxiredoxin
MLASVCLAAGGPRAITVRLQPELQEGMKRYMPTIPATVSLGPGRPEGIVAEPAYRGTPLYGVFHLGNGPRSRYILALDRSPQGETRLYVDAGRNGDLRDGRDGAFPVVATTKNSSEHRLALVLRASYGTRLRETGSAPYQVIFFNRVGNDDLNLYRGTRRTGTLNLQGRPRRIFVTEEDSDGVFRTGYDPTLSLQRRLGARLWLADPDAAPLRHVPAYDPAQPFPIGDQWFTADLAEDGSRITFHPGAEPTGKPAPVHRLSLLKAGERAPDFLAPRMRGGQARLSDYRGKAVVLTFWSDAIGEDRELHLRVMAQLQARLQQAGVVLLAMGTLNDPESLRDWVSIVHPGLPLDLLLDPKGASTQNIAYGLYHASAAPTTYIIRPDGLIADSILGVSRGLPAAIEQSLARIGIRFER